MSHMNKTRKNQRFLVSRKFLKFSVKSQGISINTIIIAAIALAVLVVLFIIFTGRLGIFSQGVKEGSLNCDKGCRTVGYASGVTRSICAADETQIPGKYEDNTQLNTLCCCLPNR